MRNICDDSNSVIFVEGKASSCKKEYARHLIGEKAYGVTQLPNSWVLPFFVISEVMFEEYKLSKHIKSIENWKRPIFEALNILKLNRQGKLLIVRSSACNEDLDSRGKYISCNCTMEDIIPTIRSYFDNILELPIEKGFTLPIIVQEYVESDYIGHLSNERRFSKDFRDWVLSETYNEKESSISIRNWRNNDTVDFKGTLDCTNVGDIKNSLKTVAKWANNQRIHFEWVFDSKNKKIFIVQADEEKKDTAAINPIVKKDKKLIRSTEHSMQCLKKVTDANIHNWNMYGKIENVSVYLDLNFPIAPLYILDTPEVLHALKNGEIPLALKTDIEYLLKNPIVIRTDISSKLQEQRQMLPRTTSLMKEKDVCDFLLENSKRVSEEFSDYIFIIHNFIISTSSAFVYAAPNQRTVFIESIWGIPEGLYFYQHDSYEVDTGSPVLETVEKGKIKVTTKINYKKYFLAPMDNGDWKVATVAEPFDWIPSIRAEEWVLELAIKTRKIAEKVKKSISTMWFVDGLDGENGQVFPWHHEEYKECLQQVAAENHVKMKFTYKTDAVIATFKDLDIYEKIDGRILRIYIRPNDIKILRDKFFIERVGSLAKCKNAVIILEGGLLTHAYYQLKRTGANIEGKTGFFNEGKQIFDKLVRDRIPEKVLSNGEYINITKILNKKEFLLYLKGKLVEEILEVCDANDEEIVEEIADLLEVIESIKENNSIEINKDIDENYYIKEKRYNFLAQLDSDKALLTFGIPLTSDNWNYDILPTSFPNIKISIKGSRKRNNLRFDIYIKKYKKPLSLIGNSINENILTDSDLFRDDRLKLVLQKRSLIQKGLQLYDEDEDQLEKNIINILLIVNNIIKIVGLDKNEILKIKQIKKMQVGGFQEGIILKDTKNHFSDTVSNRELTLISSDDFGRFMNPNIIKNDIKVSSDYRSQLEFNESLLNITVPLTNKKWIYQLPSSLLNDLPNIEIHVKGLRLCSNICLEMNIKKRAVIEEITLFPEN